jgi:hypothetical protein
MNHPSRGASVEKTGGDVTGLTASLCFLRVPVTFQYGTLQHAAVRAIVPELAQKALSSALIFNENLLPDFKNARFTNRTGDAT